jgi:hypothetical protein
MNYFSLILIEDKLNKSKFYQKIIWLKINMFREMDVLLL